MRQPIAGVTPSESTEMTVMTIWPSIAVYPSGQKVGQLCSIRWPNIYIFRVGNLLALLSIPYALFLYFCRIAPSIAIRYRLTNRRVVVERGIQGEEERAIGFADFDEIRIAVRPGQEWYPAGDLEFYQDQEQVFQLGGVSRPDTFRRTCLKARDIYVGVRAVQQTQ